jgi:hypothetical protein
MSKSREAKRAYDRRYRAENREKISHRQREAGGNVSIDLANRTPGRGLQ